MNIAKYVESKDWDAMRQQLSHMSNAEFRRTEGAIRTYMLSLDNAIFWEMWLHLLQHRHQAFLSCILSIRNLAKHDTIDFLCDEARECAAWVKKNIPDNVIKILRMAIPQLQNEQQITDVFRLFDIDEETVWVSILIREDTPLSYYMLFRALQKADDPALSRASFITVIKKNNDMAFNMASIIKTYFGLDDVKSSFSLPVQPYELSHITHSFENFYHFLTGKQPAV